MTEIRPSWMTIPLRGPIGRVLRRRERWLEALSRGHPDAKEIALHDLADDGRTEDRIRQGYTGRAAIELLQNAHDVMADAGIGGEVAFQISKSALLVGNFGLPFDEARIRALTRLGSSSKAEKRLAHRNIGYKGIGFTSVFEISDRPQVLSTSVGFAFDRAEAKSLALRYLGDGLDGPVPARYFPLALSDDELGDDLGLVQKMFDRGMATVIRLPFREDRPRSDVARAVRGTLVPEILLFMPSVEALSLEDGDSRLVWRRQTGSRIGLGRLVHLHASEGASVSWLVAKSTIAADQDVVRALDDELWHDVKTFVVGAAIPWSDRGPRDTMPDSRIYSYFPTDDTLGRGLLIHGDFYLDAARRRLELSGNGGQITREIASGAAGLAADLVESVGKWGKPVLDACTPRGSIGPAAAMIGERFEAALSNRAFVRHGRSPTLAKPEKLVRLGSDLEITKAEHLSRALQPNEDIVRPVDDQGDVRDLLDRLGARKLSPLEIADRIDLSDSGVPYNQALALLDQWLATTGWERDAVLETLQDRQVVQDQKGTWATPLGVERRALNAPGLPRKLSLPILLEPTTKAGQAFVDALEITTLDPSTGLERLLTALEEGEFGVTDHECEIALDLVWRVWLVEPLALERETRRVGAINVRARTSHAKVKRVWRRADSTYFGSDAAGDATLEHIYAPLGEAEFLAEAMEGSVAERRRKRDFFAALGVASRPRQVGVNWETAEEFYEWTNGDERADAWECVNGHPQSEKQISGWMMDRLDAVLATVDNADSGSALARALAMLSEPYGPRTTVKCTHSGHGGRAIAKPVVSYQRWRLESTPWVPVSNDPAGAELQLPTQSWRGLPRTSPWLLVPRARLRQQDAEALDLVLAERPGAEAVEGALKALAATHPDLEGGAPDARDSADWLLRRLERTLVKADRNRSSPPPLPTQGPDGWRWSAAAVVPNVPGLPRIRGLDLLPPGRWSGLQRAYGLAQARDKAVAEVRAGPRRNVPLLLTTDRRVHLLALLLRRTGESERTAARIAAIREWPTSALQLSWQVDSTSVSVPFARFVLQPRLDKQGRVIGARLTWTATTEPDPLELGRALADYLELPDEDSEIGLFFSDPERLVDQRSLTRGELDDAGYLLRSRRNFVDSADEVARPKGRRELDPAGWSPPPDAQPEQAAPAPPAPPVKGYINSGKVRFGEPEQIEAGQESPAEKVDRADEVRSGKPVGGSLDRPLPPATEEAVKATASSKRSEEAAVNIVKRYGAGLPDVVRIDDVQQEDRGWDLEFYLKNGDFIPVEVKGSSGQSPFVISANEWQAAKAHEDYVLYHVVDLTTPSRTRMRVYYGLGTRLSDAHVAAAGWAVTKWRSLEPIQIPVEEVD